MKESVKILKFNKKPDDLLSDDEVMKIFMGLFRLMKKSAEYTAIKSVESKLKSDARKIRELDAKVAKRTNPVEQLLKLNQELTAQLKLQV